MPNINAIKKILTLYAVTDRKWTTKQSLKKQVEDALIGGITAVQLREKSLNDEEFLAEAIEIKELCSKYNATFIINDNVDIALKCKADGIHVGQNDMDVFKVKKLIKNDMILGVSATNLKEALKAQEAGADYLGVGAIFATQSKSDAKLVEMHTLQEICQNVSIPVVAIGGITMSNMSKLANTGIAGVAVISAIFSAKNIKNKSRSMYELASKLFRKKTK